MTYFAKKYDNVAEIHCMEDKYYCWQVSLSLADDIVDMLNGRMKN